MQNPHAKLIKICPICDKQFETIAHHNKVYDTVQCYRRAKTQRRVNRSSPEMPTIMGETASQMMSNDYFAIVHSPTAATLENYAKTILLELNDNKPIRITGTLPAWTPTKGTEIREQLGVTPTEWVLRAHEVNPLADLFTR